MGGYRRYAIYAAPDGPLGAFGAAWLGWDLGDGTEPAAPVVPGLPMPREAVVATPRKYGFHGTIKPPFRLAAGVAPEDLDTAAAALSAGLAAVALPGLRLQRLGGFLALVPDGDQASLSALAARAVEALDPFRAPADAAEIARRNPDRLTERQRALLDRWGYPYVMEEFQFHLTLSGNLPGDQADAVLAALAPAIAPVLPRPFTLDSLALCGEGADGRFRLIRRYPLG
ncbi:MAG: DUF1045 domain-containing protein [Paracoccaceae bacterium]|nr:MAG: DUF1045 domain-containing protein [Paracoccaceae bacterium]